MQSNNNIQDNQFTKMTGLTPGVVDLSSLYGLIKIAGMDATKFLQGQLTCNVETLNTQAKLAAHCNPQGRIISLFYIFKHDGNYYLCLPHELTTIAINALKKYAIFFKVTLEDISKQVNIIGCIGAPSHNIAEHAFAEIAYPQDDRKMYICSASLKPSEYNFQPLEWKAKDLLAKIPSLYAKTSSKFLPHELNLPTLGAIDFNKGCYTGQEIIARMHYRGKVKVGLFCAEINTSNPPEIGSDVYQGEMVCGSVVETCFITKDHYLLLITANLNNTNALHLSTDTNNFLKILT